MLTSSTDEKVRSEKGNRYILLSTHNKRENFYHKILEFPVLVKTALYYQQSERSKTQFQSIFLVLKIPLSYPAP